MDILAPVVGNSSLRMSIEENVKRVRDRIYAAAGRAGIDGDAITLVAVSKTFGAAEIRSAVDASVTDVGENRVQEAAGKFGEVGRSFRRHMVGHLQTNKAKKALELFDVIESVDSLKLARKLAAYGTEGKEFLIEVNTSGEGTKFGVEPAEALDLLVEVSETVGLEVSGLMTVGPLTQDEEELRRAYRKLRRLAEDADRLGLTGVEMRYLSMGMTNDFELAIEEGSSMVRVGRAIFGERQTGRI